MGASITGASLFSRVRDTRDKAMHILGSSEGQLFDLQADSLEMHKLRCDAGHQAERARLMQSLLEWRRRWPVQTMQVMAHAR